MKYLDSEGNEVTISNIFQIAITPGDVQVRFVQEANQNHDPSFNQELSIILENSFKRFADLCERRGISEEGSRFETGLLFSKIFCDTMDCNEVSEATTKLGLLSMLDPTAASQKISELFDTAMACGACVSIEGELWHE
jgi:hypothetical protein